MDAVALIVICVLPMTGIVTISEALSGFSNPNIILIITLFILGEGLVRTGVVRFLGDKLVAKAGHNQTRLMVLLMLTACLLGSSMSSTAVTAIFIPVVLRICRRTSIPPAQLMMPLSVAALVSGTTTLIATTPNLIMNSELIRSGHKGFSFFTFTPIGLPILILAILYMLYAKRWLSPSAKKPDSGHIPRPTFADWINRYGLAEKGRRLVLSKESPLIGKNIKESNLLKLLGINIIAVQREENLVQAAAKTEFREEDIIFAELLNPTSNFEELCGALNIDILPLTDTHFTDLSQEVGMSEVIVPADSPLLGKTLLESNFRSQLDLSVIGLRRGTEAINTNHREEKLRIGDTLLVSGRWKSITNLISSNSKDLVALSLPAEFEEILDAPGKALPAVLILLFVIALMISGVIPNVHAALLGCLLMGYFGCIDYESAYRAIDWKTIVLIVGMLPFSIALQRTGGIDLASTGLLMVTDGFQTYGTLTALFIMTSLMGVFISNTATAVLMAPVALTIAEKLDASPYPFAMIVALACSCAFMTPVSSPVNTLVATPGGYKFFDFVRVGVPLTIIVMIVSVLLVPVLLPL